MRLYNSGISKWVCTYFKTCPLQVVIFSPCNFFFFQMRKKISRWD